MMVNIKHLGIAFLNTGIFYLLSRTKAFQDGIDNPLLITLLILVLTYAFGELMPHLLGLDRNTKEKNKSPSESDSVGFSEKRGKH